MRCVVLGPRRFYCLCSNARSSSGEKKKKKFFSSFALTERRRRRRRRSGISASFRSSMFNKEASSSDPIRFDEGKSKKSKRRYLWNGCSRIAWKRRSEDAEIREVRGKSTFSSGKVTSKIEGDARSALTEADVKAQAMVIGSLRKQYGKRTEYRREEDGNEDATMDSDTCESLRKDERFSECVNKAIKATARFQAEDVVALEDVCVFVDPVGH